jgi:primase-polymerase (primpol)-like protein
LAALENLSDCEDINRAWNNINENIKTSAKESLGLYKLSSINHGLIKNVYFFLDQRKQVKRHWLQDPNQINVDNANNVRCEAGRHFRNKKKEYLKAKIDELETNSKIKNIRALCRGISITNLKLL